MVFNPGDRIENKAAAFRHTVGQETFVTVPEVREAMAAMGSLQIPHAFGNLSIDESVQVTLRSTADGNSNDQARVQRVIPPGYNASVEGDCGTVALKPHPGGGTDVSVGSNQGDGACYITPVPIHKAVD